MINQLLESCSEATDGLLEYDRIISDGGACGCSSGDNSFPSEGPGPKGCKPLPDKNDGDGCGVGNPCNPATGNKFQSETDFAGNGLSFTRSYNSRNHLVDIGLGKAWRSSYHKSLAVSTDALTQISGIGRGEAWSRPVGQPANSSFEADVLPDGEDERFPSHWSRFGAGGALNPTAAAYPEGAPDGVNIAYLEVGGRMIQLRNDQLLFSATANYALAVEVGTRADALGGTANYAVRLLAGDLVSVPGQGLQVQAEVGAATDSDFNQRHVPDRHSQC